MKDKIQHCINTGVGMIGRLGQFEFTIHPRNIPEPEGPRPPKPILWKNSFETMTRSGWSKKNAEQKAAVDSWVTRKAQNVEERKTVRRLTKIMKMFS